jgi:Tfp pilus assembly protein PilF
MPCRLILVAALAGAMLLPLGCASSQQRRDERNYRTVQAEPGRNTEAARRINQQGLEHLKQERLDEAAKHFHDALAEDVEFGPAHNNLGKVYYQQKKWYKAAWEFEYARKLMPKRAEPYNNLAMVLEHGGELDRAIKQYKKAVGLAPRNMTYLGNLARAMIKRGDRTPQVRRYLQRLLEHDTRPKWLTWAQRQLATMDPQASSQ